MPFATYPKSESEAYCKSCKHTNLANEDASCSAYGYNGVDCQPQPCICREHFVTVHHKESPTTTPPDFTEPSITSGGEKLSIFEIMQRFRTDGSCEHLIKDGLAQLARTSSPLD